MEGAAGLVPVECVLLGLQVPEEGVVVVRLAPVEVVGLIPVEGGVGLVPVEGGVGLVPVEGSLRLVPVEGVEDLVPGELPEEAIAGLAMVEGVAGVVVESSLTAHCRQSVAGSRVDDS